MEDSASKARANGGVLANRSAAKSAVIAVMDRSQFAGTAAQKRAL
jgi:hypothetical protein